ncbi:MAG TPA: glycosyltransferase [Acidimicrobiales bacterium]|nr:glycosyltransferase [Acidimicrobiales bacterium]
MSNQTITEPAKGDLSGRASGIAAAKSSVTVEVVVPVYDEERDLGPNVRRLRHYLDHEFPFSSIVTIADNASTDGTWVIACQLAAEVPGVRAVHLEAKGRGRALRAVWSASEADVVAYMDVDLSTDLGALLPLVAPLLSGHSDVAIGTRLAPGSRVVRGPKREIISRAYNTILKVALRSRFSDAQCGFKALRTADARALLAAVADNEWFFDTELLVLAERRGLRIHEVPVDWTDDPDSRVAIVRTALADLKGVWRLMLARPRSQPDHSRYSAPGAARSPALPCGLEDAYGSTGRDGQDPGRRRRTVDTRRRRHGPALRGL